MLNDIYKVFCFIYKVLFYTLFQLMFKTILRSRDVNGYNKEESDHPEAKVFHIVRGQKF